MKVLITGAGGQLGQELVRWAPLDVELAALDHAALDVTCRAAVEERVARFAPQLIINAAAYTAVERAETEPDAAYAVNADGAANLARVASLGARLIHISTDFVFDGRQSKPYRPSDAPCPSGVYGASKLEGEGQVLGIARQRALVVRTSWLYSTHGPNFVTSVLRQLRRNQELEVMVDDRVGSPTSAAGLARALWRMAHRPHLWGIHHWTDAGLASCRDFAVAIHEEAFDCGLAERVARLRPVEGEDSPAPVRRPACSVLDKTDTWRALGEISPHWRTALQATMQEMSEATHA